MSSRREDRVQSGSTASAIDLVSNAVLLSGMYIGHAGWILQPGKYPLEYMASLLHETAHWETFLTLVGYALAGVFLRSWKSTQTPGDHSYDTALDFVRYSVFTETLRPLCEGMALFMEFDTLPDDSPVTTTTTLVAATLFGDWHDTPLAKKTLGEITNFNLRGARETPQFIARKENLLSQDFKTTGGGYLPGYHFVKNLRYYLISTRRLVSLLDGDLYFYVLRSVIFGDMKLARLIIDAELDITLGLDPIETADTDAVNSVLKRFQELLEYLMHDLDEEYIRDVASLVTQERWDWSEAIDPLTGEKHRADDVRHFEGQVGALYKGADRPAAPTIKKFFEHRQVLCLASFDANISVNERGWCQVGDITVRGERFPAYAGPALTGISSVQGRGKYEIYFERGFKGNRMSFSIILDDRCVAVGTLAGVLAAEEEAEILARRPLLASADELRAKMQTDIEVVLERDTVADHYLGQIGPLVENLYLRYSSAFMRLNGGSTKLAKSNLIALCPYDLDFLSEFALMSLQNGSYFLKSTLDKIYDELCPGRGSFYERLTRWKEKYGFFLHREHSEMVFLSF